MVERINDILTAIQNAATGINTLNKTLTIAFPTVTNVSSVAPSVGAVSYTSSEVSAFGLVTTSSGGNYRVALLPSS